MRLRRLRSAGFFLEENFSPLYTPDQIDLLTAGMEYISSTKNGE